MNLLRIEAEREFHVDLRKKLLHWPAPTGVRIAIAPSAELVKLRRRDVGTTSNFRALVIADHWHKRAPWAPPE
jgi:hypothetical protein